MDTAVTESVARKTDPITFEILTHRLYEIAKEMGISLERAGGTVNTTQMHDYIAALYRANGDILCAGASISTHVACAGRAVRTIIERFGEEEGGIEPDDIFLLNDPYKGAIHQSDLYMITPIHYEGKLVAWSASFVHVMDIGAMSPGGNSPGASEICHEGVRIPGLKLVERGRLRKDLFDTIVTMTRQPVMVGLDLKSEIAANNVAKARMQELCAQYGPELLDAVAVDAIRYTDSVLRKRIAEIPDGSWTATGTIQADAAWTMVLTLRKTGDRLIFDFTGSDPQANRGINLPYHATVGTCFSSVLTTLGYDLPKNEGLFGPIEVIAPEGTVVNVQYPGPVSLNTTSGGATAQYLTRLTLTQMVATSESLRQEVIAVNAGHRFARHAGVNQHGQHYVSTLADGLVDGSGARSWGDGMDSANGHMTFHNVEWLEANFPLLYLFRRHVQDGAGAGRFRGGAGVESALTLHDAPEGTIKGVALGVAGLRNSGQGLFGGYPAAPSLLVHVEDARVGELSAQNRQPMSLEELGGEARLLPYCDFAFKAGDVLYVRSGCGGGYGDPLDRDPSAVVQDIENGLVSPEAACSVYGVAVQSENGQVDAATTEAMRSRLRAQRLEAPDR